MFFAYAWDWKDFNKDNVQIANANIVNWYSMSSLDKGHTEKVCRTASSVAKQCLIFEDLEQVWEHEQLASWAAKTAMLWLRGFEDGWRLTRRRDAFQRNVYIENTVVAVFFQRGGDACVLGLEGENNMN